MGTRGEIEPPEGRVDMGNYTVAIYNEEQRQRLGIDEYGQKVPVITAQEVLDAMAKDSDEAPLQ